MSLPVPDCLEFWTDQDQLLEVSRFRVGGRELLLSELAPPDEQLEFLFGQLGISDDSGGRVSYCAEIDLCVMKHIDEPICQLTVQLIRTDRDAALAGGLALGRLLMTGQPLAGVWRSRLVCVPGPDMPALLMAYGSQPEIGECCVVASADTTVETVALVRRLAPGASWPA